MDLPHWIYRTALDLPQRRSPFNHDLFFCTLCSCHRKAHDEPDAPFQKIYSSKSVLQMIMDHAFVEPAREINLSEASKWFSDRGKQVDLTRAREIDLIEAVKSGRMSDLRAKLHLTNVDINSGDQTGRTAVYWAGIRGNIEALQLLLKHGGDPNRSSNYGSSPVAMAQNSGKTEAVALLKAAGGRL